MDECLDAVPCKVTLDMQNILSSEFNADEIKVALFQMGPAKAPGLDGVNALFYQNFWHIVGDIVIAAVLDYLNSGIMVLEINHTNIVLILNVKNPEKMTDFRPISLCNVMYKIISKVLANRLKRVLPHIISSTQSAFVPGHLITDNVLVAYETLHAMHSRKKGKKGLIALKLDISKAYDRVEWSFLQGIMQRMGFLEGWIKRVMGCVTTSTFSVLINRKPFGNIHPSRESVKEILFHHICFFCVQRALLPFGKRQNWRGVSMEYQFVDEHQQFLTYYLQMILYYSVGQPVIKLR